jgi:FkbM family methyltransferase
MLIHIKTLLDKYQFMPTGILHVGASTGQEAKDYFNSGVESVIWIEAIPNVFNQLVRNIQEFPRMVAFNECVGNEDGKEMCFNISNNEAQSSSLLELDYHKTDHPDVFYCDKIQVKTKRIDTLLKEKGIYIADYNFINIDLQGAELMALQGMGELLRQVKYAYLEVNKKHEYKDCPLLDDIDAYMFKYGFTRVELEWCGGFSWGDAVYIKDSNAVESAGRV